MYPRPSAIPRSRLPWSSAIVGHANARTYRILESGHWQSHFKSAAPFPQRALLIRLSLSVTGPWRTREAKVPRWQNGTLARTVVTVC